MTHLRLKQLLAFLTVALAAGLRPKDANAQCAAVTAVSTDGGLSQPTDAQCASSSAALPVTAATQPVEAAPSAAELRDDRLRAVRDACRAARGTDVLGIIATPTLAIAGVSLAAIGFTTPPPQRGPDTFFLNAFGPGLVLGAIGVPLGRGWISAGDPMRVACDGVLTHTNVSDSDLLALEGLLHAYGASASPLLTILLAAATVATGGGVALAFALQNRDLAQAMGGISAAVVAGWAIVPPTPSQRATVRYHRGGFAPQRVTPTIAVAPTSQSAAVFFGVAGMF